MIFSSLTFLCIFLPLVYILYWIMPSLRLKNALLIAASLIFYAYGEPVYVLLLILSSFINYLCARGIAGHRERKKPLLVLSVVINLGMLAVFKYAAFFVTSLNGMFHFGIPVPEITLPIGISFFTFQAMSYVIDVYTGTVEVQKSYAKILLYISFFPQLIAGPIIKYHDISAQINDRHMDWDKCAAGMRRFICGLSKKVLISNTMGMAADNIFAASLSEVNALGAWIGAAAYMLQIYYDFSGYSDMAIGLGSMFGFKIRENFLYPYGATSIKEFWRRWHISLSTWFKEYLYIPLGGNRKGRVRASVNKLIVFFLTGLWHGASWTFVVWGLFHGAFLFLEEFVPVLKRLPKVLGHIYALLVICVGFVIFRADTLSQGLALIGKMFTDFTWTGGAMGLALNQLTPWFLFMLAAAVIGSAPIRPLADMIRRLLYPADGTASVKAAWLRRGLYLASAAGLMWCMLRLSGSSYNPFIYFRF